MPKQTFWISCVVTLWATITFASISTTAPSQPSESEEEVGTIAVFRFHGPLQEAPAMFDFGFQLEPQQTLHELLKRFKRAQKDESLQAVVLTFDDPQLGWAQIQELRKAITALRAADKDVYCLLETVTAGAYQLATAASRICMVPTGDLQLMGLHVEQPYLKGLLDKIGIEADIEHIGAYKGAGEPFTRTGPSDEAKAMLDWLVDDLFDQMVQTIADGRQMTPQKVRALIDRGPFTAKQAVEVKLVDEVTYAEEFLESLCERYDKAITLVHNYGQEEEPGIDFSNIFALFNSLGKAMAKGTITSKQSVAVIYVDGMIVSGRTEDDPFGDSGRVGSTSIRRVLNKACRDDTIKAVVLRVNSPGGSALASDIIWHAASDLASEKPLIVSMGNVAASGGYYVSAGAKMIFADPGTITGSIGVVGGKIVTKGFWDWLGVSFYEKSIGANADLFNTNRKWDDRQRKMMRKYMQDVYEAFTDRVIRGRKDRLKKDLDQLAGGRVYTGKQAEANGLVDKLGGLQDAIAFAATEAGIKRYDIRLLPEPKNFFDYFFKGMRDDADDDSVDLSLTKRAVNNGGWTLKAPGVADFLDLLRASDPIRAKMVLGLLQRVELLAKEHALLVMPSEFCIR